MAAVLRPQPFRQNGLRPLQPSVTPRLSLLNPAAGFANVGCAHRALVRSPSVRMFNLLPSDGGCPRMLSFFPDRVAGPLEFRIGECPNSDCDQFGALLEFPENGSPAFWTKIEGHHPPAISPTRITFSAALSEPDLLSRIKCLNTESASRPALAFEAMAHGHADRAASNYESELSATASRFAIRHVNSLSTETNKPIRARTRVLAPQDARRKLPCRNRLQKTGGLRTCLKGSKRNKMPVLMSALNSSPRLDRAVGCHRAHGHRGEALRELASYRKG